MKAASMGRFDDNQRQFSIDTATALRYIAGDVNSGHHAISVFRPARSAAGQLLAGIPVIERRHTDAMFKAH